MINFLDKLSIFLPSIFAGIIFVLVLLGYILQQKRKNILKFPLRVYYQWLLLATIIFDFIFAIFLTWFQYYIWSSHEFSKVFVNSPLGADLPLAFLFNKAGHVFGRELGYFLFYSFSRFWLEIILALICALIFWLILRIIEKHFVNLAPHEVNLGILLALLVGWPRFVIFLPLVFVFAVVDSIYRQIRFHGVERSYTNLSWPFLLAGLTTLIIGGWLVKIMGLSVLVV